MGFDFENAEKWEVSLDTYLPAGNHVCEIVSASGEKDSSGGHPQIELEVRNAQGSRKDWIVYNAKSVSKVSTLFEVAGVQLTNTDQKDGKILEAKVGQLVGKTVGVVVRDEQKYGGNPGEMVPRIQGYVPADLVQTNGSPQVAAAGVSDDSIPF